MINDIYDRSLDYVYRLDYPNYLSNNDIDFILNGWSGRNTDRTDTARTLNEEDFHDMYEGSASALEQGAEKTGVVNSIQSFYPRYITPEDSLEVAAVENLQNTGLVEDDITYNNMQDPDTDPYEGTEYATRNLLYDEFNKAVDDTMPRNVTGVLKFIGEAALSGLSLDRVSIDNIKNTFTNIDWGNAETWNQMKEAYRKELDKQVEQGTFTSFIKDMQNRTLSIEDIYQRDAVRRMVMGGRLDDWANGFAVFSGIVDNAKNAIRAAKIGGNISGAKLLVANGDDITELYTSVAKKSTGGDNLPNYSNADVITHSLKETAQDNKIQNIQKLYHNEMAQTVSKEDIENVVRNTYDIDVDRSYLDVTNIIQDGDNVKATVLIGNGVDNQAAMTKRGVDNLAKDLGIKDYQTVRKDGAGYYLQTTVTEPGLVGDLPTAEFGARGFGRTFGGSSIMPEWFHTELLAGYRKASKMEETLFKNYQRSARYLSNSDKKVLNEIYLRGQRANNGRGAWVNVNKLYDDGEISRAVRDAYTNFRKVNDLDYMISNQATRNKLIKAGYVSDLEDDIVKPVRTGITKTPNFSQMVIKNGDEMITATTHSAQQVEEMLKQSGNILVEIAPISVKGHALPYTHKIISPDKVTKQLKTAVLPYRAGGRRRYAYGTNFLKIGQTMQLNGEKVNAYSRIIGATADEKQAREIAKEINRALDYVQEMVETGDTTNVAAKLVREPFQYINVSNTDDLNKLADGLDYTQRVQVLKEGEHMIYNNGLRTLFEDPLDYDTAFAEMALVQGNFYSKRGQILTDFLGKEAKLVDIQDIFDQVVKRASTNNALGSLYEGMGKLFKDKYIEYIDTNVIRNPRTLSGIDLLRYGKLKEFSEVSEMHHQALREAKNLQLIYQRLAKIPTEYDKALNNTMRAATNLVAKTNILNERQLAALAKSDPFSWGRALLFQTTMGLFNLKQLWAQGMGAITMGLAHPVLFTRAMLAAPVMTAAYLSKESSVMRGIYKTMAKGVGISGETFENLIKYFDEYGTTMGTYRSPMTEIIHTHKYLDKAGEILRWPVEWGTNYANIVNDIAAYLEAGGKNWKKIAARADDFSMNQTRATRSAFQAGQHLPTKTIAQFTSWPHRVLESAFNKRLTTREKIGVFTGQVVLWGAVGTLVSDPENQINLNIKLREEMEWVPDEIKNLFLDGIVKSWMKEEGLYAQEGIGGAEILDTVVKLANAIESGGTDIQLPGGFTWPTRLGSAVKTALWISGVNIDPGDSYTPYHVAKKIVIDPNAPSGLRNVSKFILGYWFNEAYTTNGRLIDTDITKEQATGELFGMSLSDSAQAQALYMIHNNMEKTIDEFYDDMVGKYLRQWNPGDSEAVKQERMSILKENLQAVHKLAASYGVSGIRYAQQKIRSGFKYQQMRTVDTNKKYTGQLKPDSIYYDIIKTYSGE